MATPTLAKSLESDRPYDGKLIDELTETINKVEQPKPPQPDLSVTIITPTNEERRIRNAAMLLELWAIGEELPKPTFKAALGGFPDGHTDYAHQAGKSVA